jgi:hypothetical protein
VDVATKTGLFALGGVIVGGVVNGAVTFTMERRREGWAARKEARNFLPRIMRCRNILSKGADRGVLWELVDDGIAVNLQSWPEVAPAFAGSLDWARWITIYSAVRRLEQEVLLERNVESRISADDHEYVEQLDELLIAAALVLAGVAIFGTRRRLIARKWDRLRERLRPTDPEKLMEAAAQKVGGDWEDPIVEP